VQPAARRPDGVYSFTTWRRRPRKMFSGSCLDHSAPSRMSRLVNRLLLLLNALSKGAWRILKFLSLLLFLVLFSFHVSLSALPYCFFALP